MKNKAKANKNYFTDSLIDHIQANIFLINVSQDGNFRFEKFNKAEENATGLTNDFLKGKTPVEVFGEEQGRKIEANYRRCLEEGRMISYEESLDLPRGKKTGLTKLSPVWLDGRIVQIVATSMDITAQKKEAEKRLQESEQDFQTLFKTMAQGVVYQDKTGKIIAANPAAERILGVSLDQMQGRTSTDPNWKIIHEDGSPFLGEEHPAMMALKPVSLFLVKSWGSIILWRNNTVGLRSMPSRNIMREKTNRIKFMQVLRILQKKSRGSWP